MKATIEVLSDEDLMEQIRESKKDKERSRVRKFEDVAKELNI